MRVKRVGNGVYVSIDKKYAICKSFDGEWNIYKRVYKTDSILEYIITYKYLADAKKYIEDIMAKEEKEFEAVMNHYDEGCKKWAELLAR